MMPFQRGVIACRMKLRLEDNPFSARAQPECFRQWREGWIFAFEGVLV